MADVQGLTILLCTIPRGILSMSRTLRLPSKANLLNASPGKKEGKWRIIGNECKRELVKEKPPDMCDIASSARSTKWSLFGATSCPYMVAIMIAAQAAARSP